MALPVPDDAHPLQKYWEILNGSVSTEGERLILDLRLVRPS
jgi:hypothetical protein